MEARCYRGGVNRTRMKEPSITWVDYVGFGSRVYCNGYLINPMVVRDNAEYTINCGS